MLWTKKENFRLSVSKIYVELYIFLWIFILWRFLAAFRSVNLCRSSDVHNMNFVDSDIRIFFFTFKLANNNFTLKKKGLTIHFHSFKIIHFYSLSISKNGP
mgnify:CR=1 FL=1